MAGRSYLPSGVMAELDSSLSVVEVGDGRASSRHHPRSPPSSSSSSFSPPSSSPSSPLPTITSPPPTTTSPPPTPAEQPRSENETDMKPMVFLCAGCRRPVGDTLSWVTNDEEKGCILLRSAANSVSVDVEQQLSKRPGECGCMIELLFCSGCSMVLGSIYRCTPKHLDYKRDLFCFSVDSLESYVLGSSEKQAVTEDEPLTLESRAFMEEMLQRVDAVLKVLEAKMAAVESSVASLHEEV